MAWSWRVGRIAGIDVHLHVTFLLLLGWVALSHYLAHRDVGEAAAGLVFMLALFAIIVLHELGHALAARRYGIRTRDITLLPIGGLARLERMPEDPKQELVVALAGPAVNVFLAALIFAGLSLVRGLGPPSEAFDVGGGFFERLFWVNVTLVVFNMLPAFPMDGGRVLRALLSFRLDHVRATQIAASVGQGMAMMFGFAGLMSGNPILLFIALFVWVGAAQEASMAMMRSALEGITVRRAMITDFQTLHPEDRLAQAVEHLIAGFQQDFPVVEGDHVVGVLTRNDLITALGRDGPDVRVDSAMQREFVTVTPNEFLQNAFARLSDCNCRTLPVTQNGSLLGLLTTDNLAEVLMIQEALQARPSKPGGDQSLPVDGPPRGDVARLL